MENMRGENSIDILRNGVDYKWAILNFDGEKYKQASKHQKEWGNKLISALNLIGNEIILDLGCGDGVLTRQLSALVPRGKVIGIDASTGMLETAMAPAQYNLTFICMDIDNIDFINTFDIIFSNAALHWVKNHKKLMRNSLAALKPNGSIQWNFAGDGTGESFNSTVTAIMNQNEYKGYFTNFEWPWYMPSKDEYEEILGNAGFSKVQLTFENADRYFANGDEMIRWIDQPSIVPFIQYVPDGKKESFRNAVIDMMIERTRETDGRCLETFRRINVKAIKPHH